MKKIAVFLVALACCLCCGILAGCGSGDSASSPSSTVDTALKAIQANDDDALNAVCVDDVDIAEAALGSIFDFDDSDMSESTQKAIDSLMAKICDFDYTLGKESIDGDTATVEVSFKTYDIESMLVQWLGAYALELAAVDSSGETSAIEEAVSEALTSTLNDALDATSEKTVESSATISLEKVDGTWKISSLTDQILDAIFAGSPEALALYEATQDAAGAFADQLNALSDKLSSLSQGAEDVANAITEALK